MLDAAALRSLADLDGPERAFLTIYLDAGDDPSVIDARATRVRALLSDQPAELEHFEESLAMAREMVETHAPTEGALAVFASWAADLRRAYALPEPVGTTLWMGDAPYLRPAAELLDEHETYAAVVLDNTKARIYLVSADEVDEEGRVRGDIKNRVKKGGWSQKRYARRRDKQLETYATELAADLATLDAERPFARLVVVGSEEPARALAEALRQDAEAATMAAGGAVGSGTTEAAQQEGIEPLSASVPTPVVPPPEPQAADAEPAATPPGEDRAAQAAAGKDPDAPDQTADREGASDVAAEPTDESGNTTEEAPDDKRPPGDE